MAHWTEAKVLPTVHEVLVDVHSKVVERLSLAVFLRPDRNAVLKEGKDGEGLKEEERRMTYGRWAQEKATRRCWLIGRA